MSVRPRAVLLMGPTASGKSACALAVARALPVEIVSVDSAQVYRGMDLGSAKPTLDERAVCPHHLLDIRTPAQRYSAAEFVEDALRLIGEINTRGAIALLAGGTMLYFKALREGLSDLPRADAALRAEIDAAAADRGWPALHAELARLDARAAARLHPTDAQRVQRALEIVRLTGRPLDESYAQREQAPPLDSLPLALCVERSALHQRIETRFDAMLAAGLEDEVRRLRANYALESSLPSMRSVGYRQMWDYLDGTCDWTTMRARGVAATRQLAKRQITWLRQFRETWADLEEYDGLAPDTPARLITRIRQWWHTNGTRPDQSADDARSTAGNGHSDDGGDGARSASPTRDRYHHDQ